MKFISFSFLIFFLFISNYLYAGTNWSFPIARDGIRKIVVTNNVLTIVGRDAEEPRVEGLEAFIAQTGYYYRFIFFDEPVHATIDHHGELHRGHWHLAIGGLPHSPIISPALLRSMFIVLELGVENAYDASRSYAQYLESVDLTQVTELMPDREESEDEMEEESEDEMEEESEDENVVESENELLPQNRTAGPSRVVQATGSWLIHNLYPSSQ